MKKKLPLYSELCYVLGVVLLGFGTSLMEKGDFGLSSVVAPAYLVHLKLSEFFSWFTFGKAEYLVQGLLLIAMCLLIRKFKFTFLMAFLTALIYGFILDLFIPVVAHFPMDSFALRLVWYISGFFINVTAISFMFKTYLSPGAYELFVREVSRHFKKPLGKTKIIYDYSSMVLAVILSFVFFGWGHFEGIKLGSILCALVNGWFISFIVKFLDEHFETRDAFKWRRFFEVKEKD